MLLEKGAGKRDDVWCATSLKMAGGRNKGVTGKLPFLYFDETFHQNQEALQKLLATH
jgi:L-cysteine desulfidase